MPRVTVTPSDTSDNSKPSSSPPPRSSGLLALGSAAVVVVYAAGFVRTGDAVPEAPTRRAPIAVGATDSSLARAPESPIVAAGAPVADSVRPPATEAAVPLPVETLQTTAPSTATTVEPSGAPIAVMQPTAPTKAPVKSSPATPSTTPVIASAPADTAAPDSLSRSAARWRDGTWSGWGSSRHGDIEATVLIENGRITAAAISQCLTLYSCSWIAHLQGQPVARQSPEVDNVSGATESANAFYFAVVDALKKAK